jgi:DNA repair exonuclease SbcCD ATPase subunit
MARNSAAPIMTNESVVELIKLMRENNAPSARDFFDVLKQVGAMEKQLEAAVGELAAMRRELAEAQKQNHPVKTTLQKAVIAMQGQVLELREKLAALKDHIIDGCKNAIEAFKEKGIAALDSIARFFKVKPILENMRENLDKNIRFDDKAIAKIEAVSAEYHAAGRHIKNIGRAITGKEAVQAAKPVGIVAKTIAAPFRAERGHFVSMKKNVEAAIGSVARLEERAAERKPPIRQTIAEMQKKVDRDREERPAPVRTRKMEHDM